MAAPEHEATAMDVEDEGDSGQLPADEAIGGHVLGHPYWLTKSTDALLLRAEGDLEAALPEPEAPSDRTDSQLHEKIKAFKDQREEERRRMFRTVVRLSFRLFSVGPLCIAAGQGLRVALPDSHLAPAVMIVGFFVMMLGVVIGSCCPYDLLDFDEVAAKNPKSMLAMTSFAMMVNVLQVRYFPHLDALKILLGLVITAALLMAACGLRPPRCWPTASACIAWYLSMDGFSWGGIFIFHEQNDWLTIPEIPCYVLACINIFYSATAFAGWFGHRWHYAALERGNSRRFYKVIYYWCIAGGLRWAFYGLTWMAYPKEGSEDVVAAALELLRGLSTMLPSLAVLVVGRDRFFETLGRSFDKDGARLRRDGAFVAELLETVPLQLGQTWWIHREVPDESHPASDPRRCWQRGHVTEVTDQTEFSVSLQEPAAATRRSVGRGTTAAASVRVKLPGAGKGESKEGLLLRAQRDLRCVEFENLSQDLMYRVDSRNRPDLQAAWHGLSRPVRPGEKIDYFMSNSWYDDPVRKWEKLTEVAERFQKRNGRYPTFWLDKLCIDQQQITDGLKVLPVNVMACSKLLALCGDTYLSRLWCIWELFTLFAFVDETAALDRIEFAFLGTYEAGMNMLDGMADFHVGTAHCYDPNEEARLLQVIEAVGTARFDARVANMARMTKSRMEKQKQRGAGSWKGSGLQDVAARATPPASGGEKRPAARAMAPVLSDVAV